MSYRSPRPIIISPASDHAVCSTYADVLSKKFDWHNNYIGARAEAGLGRILGAAAYQYTLKHLRRVLVPEEQDFISDIVIVGRNKEFMIDSKVSEPRDDGFELNLLVENKDPRVYYVFSICRQKFPRKDDVPCDLEFEVAGWRKGDEDDRAWSNTITNGKPTSRADGRSLRPLWKLQKAIDEEL